MSLQDAEIEIVRLGHIFLGVIRWNEFLRFAQFEACRKELVPLERQGWDCPVTARRVIQDRAREAGIG